MFTLNHFLWLGISAVIIVTLLVVSKKLKLKIDTVVTIMIIMSICSEVTKIMCNMMPSPHREGGRFLDPGDLPFHLCSIQIFFMFGYKFLAKTDKAKETILAFQVPTMLLGAIIALFVPTVGVKFTVIQVYQYFIYHSFIIFFPIYILREKLVKWEIKTYGVNLAIVGMIALIVLWINSFLSVAVCTCEECLAGAHNYFARANFMYLTHPPMDNLPLLNLDNGWYCYFLTLASLVIVLLGIFHVVAYSVYKKSLKKNG
ncbi:MAG: YwaF family protein [Clostridia bacterium]|nr:YwaF family protein [Clostridia bacterium]